MPASPLLPYENLLIGDFVYGLGFVEARTSSPDQRVPRGKVRLLQQTPADTFFGDVLPDLDGRSYFLEFKRAEGDVGEDPLKPNRVGLWDALQAAAGGLRGLSERGHFAVWPRQREGDAMWLHFQAYPTIRVSHPVQRGRGLWLDEWLAAALVTPSRIGLSPSERDEYARAMIKHADAAFNDGGAAEGDAATTTARRDRVTSTAALMVLAPDRLVTVIASPNLFALARALTRSSSRGVDGPTCLVRPAESDRPAPAPPASSDGPPGQADRRGGHG